MTYDEALLWINSMPAFSAKRYDIKGIEKLLEVLGNPQDKLNFIHIAGTNGKGSTSAFCSSSLIESGLKTGLFISPYIIDYRERIQIDGKMISKFDLLEMITLIKSHVESLKKQNVVLSHFDIITSIAIIYFCKEACDIVVMETGLGGRLDSTNVIKSPKVSIITHISYDHTDVLGNDILDIAREKAGILKPGSLCVCCNDQENYVKKVISSRCEELGINMIESYFPSDVISNENGSSWVFDNVRYKTKLIGEHQIKNAMLAITALLNLKIDKSCIKRGIAKASLPVRLEKVWDNPIIILDGAHNPDGVAVMSKSIALFKKRPVVCLLSMLKRKDYKSALKQISFKIDRLIITEMDFDDVLPANELAKAAVQLGFDIEVILEPKEALKCAKKIAKEDGMVIVFGSLYFASQVRKGFFDKLN